MELLWWALVGLIAAIVGKPPFRGRDLHSTYILNAGLAVVGGVLGGYLVQTFALGHRMEYYFLWSTAFCFGTALAVMGPIGLLVTQVED